MKKKKKIIPAIIIVIAVAIGFTLISQAAARRRTGGAIDFIKLEKGELETSVNVKGVVKSKDSRNVYVAGGYQILEVLAEVGDKVTAGQELLRLDTDELRLSLNERRALLSKQSESGLTNLENARRQYNEAISNLNSETDSNLVSAKSRVETSLNSLNNAQINYDEKVKEHGERVNSQQKTAETNVRNAESNVRNAEIDLDKRQTDYNNSKILHDNGTISQSDFDAAELALTNSQNALKDAQDALADAEQNFETVKTNTGIDQDSELRALSQALETARINYEDALASLDSVKLTLNQNIEKLDDSVKTAEISRDTNADLIAIESLETRLEKAVCLAPIDGTVTAVYAKEGANANGLMFVVEDAENLRIDTRLKEFDSSRVKEDMEVIITSDATGEEKYEGAVFKVAPASVKNAAGEPDTTSDVEFETEIKVSSPKTGLKIGMNAKLTIILERRENILYVPFEALGANDDGDDAVYVLTPAANGSYVVTETPVDILLETDFYAQIEGSGIKEGVLIASNSSDVSNGATVKINAEAPVEENN